MKLKRTFTRLLAATCIAVIPSCDDIENLNTILDRIENQLATAPEQWITIISNEADGLRGDMARDLRTLMEGAVSGVGNQSRCFLDHAANRLTERIRALKNDLLDRELSDADTMRFFQPFICDTMPKRVDLTRGSGPASLTWNGFNLDPSHGLVRKHLRAWVKKSGGAPVNVTDFLTNGNVYEVTLNFSGNGFPMEREHNVIELRWGAAYDSSTLLSEVAVLQPEFDTATVDGRSVTIEPRRTDGNNEFGGNGPLVTAKAELQVASGPNPTTVRLKTSAVFSEYEGDGSRANGTTDEVVYRAPLGWAITKIVGASPDPRTLQEDLKVLMVGHNEATFRPSNLGADCKGMVDAVIPRTLTRRVGNARTGIEVETVPNPAYASTQRKVRDLSSATTNGLVTNWAVKGDRNGDDIGSWTRIKITTGKVIVEIRKIYQ